MKLFGERALMLMKTSSPATPLGAKGLQKLSDPSCRQASMRAADRNPIIELQILYPPSVNHIWRRAGKHIHRSSQYTKWLKDAGYQIIAQRPGSINGPYKISLNAVRPDRRKRDLGNLLKATEDLLVSVGVIDDDSKAEMIVMRWVTQGSGVHVRVERAGVE